MENRKYFKKSKFYGKKAQAIVEFAIALPILLALILGIFEVGRLMFIYSAVTNSSRNAVRYASAVGLNDSGYTKYNYCYGIYETAKKSAFLINITIPDVKIYYDDGLGNPLSYPECKVWASPWVDTGVNVSSGNRVTVIVTAQYKPMLKLIPIPARTITSKSSRTILGIVNLGP
jgi:Flp pilus assembly protein TadG